VAAMVVGKSRTGATYRGTGLQRIRQLAKHRVPAHLRVFSGRGQYDARFGTKSANRTMSVRNHTEAIEGTLICWEVSIKSRPTG